MSVQLDTAVLFMAFNRPATTEKVFDAIRKAKPTKLYLSVDGPRRDVEGEIAQVEKVQNIVSNIDWPCEVKKLFRKENKGCKNAVSGAISWFFEHEEMGIILEDDCLPSQSFFPYCSELLERYKNDLRVAQISGFNYGYNNKKLKYDYIFSKYAMIWGWATWRDRWEKYSLELGNLDEVKESDQLSLLFGRSELARKLRQFDRVKSGGVDTWDYQWSYMMLINNQFTIIPKNNLILNIGFGEDSTHTSGKNLYERLLLEEIPKIDSHPDYIVQHKRLYRHMSGNTGIFRRFVDLLRSL